MKLLFYLKKNAKGKNELAKNDHQPMHRHISWKKNRYHQAKFTGDYRATISCSLFFCSFAL